MNCRAWSSWAELRAEAEAKLHPAHLGLTPVAGAVDVAGGFEFGLAGEHGQNHAPGRAGGIDPRLSKAAQARADGPDAFGYIQRVASAARQTATWSLSPHRQREGGPQHPPNLGHTG